MSNTLIHHAAAHGFAANAGGYARGRPDYPAALDRWLCDAVHLASGRSVVDLGAGTGKFTPRLLATGAQVIAIEPVDAMRDRLATGFPQVDARAGSAEALPLEDASVDAVACAQAFHWFANAIAMTELARVVRPGGVLALIWNVRDESVPWVRRITDLITPYEGDAPRYHRGDWRRVFPAAGFGPLVEARFPHAHVGSPEVVIVERFLSVSFIAALHDSERVQVAQRLRQLIADEPSLAGEEEISFPYETVVYHTVRA
jgi:SAM-dependent methyltransferase